MMIYSAGKITVATALTAVFVFSTVFLLDIGRDQFQTVSAQSGGTATTSLTVRNLPPVWVVEAFEQNASATNTPINSGLDAVWEAEATNNHPYWLLICSTNDTPVPVAGALGDEGNPANAPSCGGGIQWAVSGPTASGNTATAATTTTNDFGNPFEESNDWYAWVCDADSVDPRCSTVPVQGEQAGGDAASPFVVNFRPILTSVSNDGPTLPGDTITFTSVSSDPNTLRGNDEIVLHICATNSFTNGECDSGQTLATSSAGQTSNATAEFEIFIPTVRYTYEAFAFLVDEFNHEAENSEQSDFDVANATPTVTASSISLNGGLNMVPSVPLGTTTGFTLEFDVYDANSCVAVDGAGDTLGAGSEFADVIVSVFRSGIGSTTCDGTAGPFDENNCYTSALDTQWDFTCTASTTTCTDNGLNTTDPTMTYECEFSLWYVADPTDSTDPNDVQFDGQHWMAAVSVIDAEFATSSFIAQTNNFVDVERNLSFALGDSAIPYGSLEPGFDTGNLPATTTIIATGNTGINQDLYGSRMCRDNVFNVGGVIDGTECDSAAVTERINSENQRFGFSPSDSFSTADPLENFDTNIDNSSVLAEIQVAKPTAILTPPEEGIYWGIAVPASINLAGTYVGQNVFTVLQSNATTW